MTRTAAPMIDAMRAAARSATSVTTSDLDVAADLQRSENATMARKAVEFAEIEAQRLHEAAGFSSVVSWARARLQLKPRTTRSLVRIGQMLGHLPHVADAAFAGDLSYDHLVSFDYAIRIVGHDETVEAEDALLAIAVHSPAEEFHAVLRKMHEATHDELDAAWVRGMDKQDITLVRTLEGWEVAGFLSIELGTKLKVILDSLSVPREADDRRAPSARRVQALDALCDSVLRNGLPSDTGVRPHLRVVVDSTDTEAAANLEKFGPIGPGLVAHLACEADWTRLVVRNSAILDVGRTRRYATPKQTHAIWHRQDGQCAGHGCVHSVAHVHHIDPWSLGGRTDLDNLIGLCGRCHTLVHQGRLKLQPRLARAG